MIYCFRAENRTRGYPSGGDLYTLMYEGVPEQVSDDEIFEMIERTRGERKVTYHALKKISMKVYNSLANSGTRPLPEKPFKKEFPYFGEDYLIDQFFDHQGKQVNVVMKHIMDGTSQTNQQKQDRYITLLSHPTGSGKTKCLYTLGESDPHNAMVILCNCGYTEERTTIFGRLKHICSRLALASETAASLNRKERLSEAAQNLTDLVLLLHLDYVIKILDLLICEKYIKDKNVLRRASLWCLRNAEGEK